MTSDHSGSNGEERGHRRARLAQLLHEELQSLLRDEVADPALEGVTVLAVHLSPDGGNARVAYVVTAAGDEHQVRQRSKAALARAAGFLRVRVAQQLDLKRTPTLSFSFVGLASEGGGSCLA